MGSEIASHGPMWRRFLSRSKIGSRNSFSAGSGDQSRHVDYRNTPADKVYRTIRKCDVGALAMKAVDLFFIRAVEGARAGLNRAVRRGAIEEKGAQRIGPGSAGIVAGHLDVAVIYV